MRKVFQLGKSANEQNLLWQTNRLESKGDNTKLVWELPPQALQCSVPVAIGNRERNVHGHMVQLGIAISFPGGGLRPGSGLRPELQARTQQP